MLRSGPLLFAVALLGGVALAYEANVRGPEVFVIAVLPIAGWLLFRPYLLFVCGVVVTFLLPSWLTLASPQLSVMRLATVCCVFGGLASRRRDHFSVRLVDVALAAYVAVFVLGWLLQYDQPHVGRVVSVAITPIAFYIGARAISSDRIGRTMCLCAIAGAVGGLTVLLDLVVGHALFADTTSYFWQAGPSTIFRPAGVFGGPFVAAEMMTFAILFGLGSIGSVSGVTRRALQVSICICAAALVATFTRADLIGCGVGLVLFVTLLRPKWARPLRLGWLCAMAGVAWLVFVPVVSSNAVFQKGIVRPGTFASRVGFWSEALPVVTSSTHNVVFGLGTGTLEAPSVGDDVAIPAALAAAPVITEISLQNQYVTTFFEQGTIGLCWLALVLLGAFVPVTRLAMTNRDPVSAALAASILALMVSMVAETALLVQPVCAVTMVAIAFAVTTARPGSVLPTN